MSSTNRTDLVPLEAGDRIEVTGLMPEEPNPIPVGTQGTVVKVYHAHKQVDVNWDNGRKLMLLTDVDPYRKV